MTKILPMPPAGKFDDCGRGFRGPATSMVGTSKKMFFPVIYPDLRETPGPTDWHRQELRGMA
jgi:hypothetical protein